MNKLPKVFFDRLEDLQKTYNAQLPVLKAAIEEYNTTIKEAYEKLKEEVDLYNEQLSEVNSFIADVREELQNTFDERSDKWQESDAGSDFQNWIDSWENVDEFMDYELNAYDTYCNPDEIEFNFDMEKP